MKMEKEEMLKKLKIQEEEIKKLKMAKDEIKIYVNNCEEQIKN